MNFHAGYPMAFSFEPTTSCNLRCPECPSGLRSFSRPTGNLRMNDFKSVVDQLCSRTLFLTFYFQGEPYINPSFLDMVGYASSRKLYTSTSTNAHFLDDESARRTVESGLDRLIISIDGTDQQTYEAYRVGGNLEKVKEGAANVIRWKKKLGKSSPEVVFQFLVVRPNQHQVSEINELGREMGADRVVLKSAQVYNYGSGNDLIPDIDAYSRYRKEDDGSWTIKNKLLNQCWRMWSSCVITWDGDVVPCCFDKDARHKLGNAYANDFSFVWRSKPYDDFRKAILKSRSEIDICTNCTEGSRVWV